MDLHQKYTEAVQAVSNLGMEGSTEERDGKLHITGTVKSEVEKDAIWDAIKVVPDWEDDVVADVKVAPKPGIDAPVSSMKTYTVKPGDTLDKIAEEFLGHASEYMRIFEANKDQLKDPNGIEPGQVLKIPALERQIT